MLTHRRKWLKRSGISARATRHRRLRFEDLEPRLALTWAGVPPTMVAISASVPTVTLNAQADASGAAAITSTEVDYYGFTAKRTGSYTMSASTPNSTVDTVLGVFSSTGARLAYNDDIVLGVNTDSRLTVNLTAGTWYYIGITNYTSTSQGSYTWTIDGPAAAVADDGYENNDSFSTAYNLGSLTSGRTINQLVMADTQDWYRFTSTATGTSSNNVLISFQNSQGNLQLALYNSAGTLLASSLGTGNNETISLSGRAAGTYYVAVYGNGEALNPNYSLSINAPTAPTAAPTPAPTTTSTGGFQITLNMTGLTASQQAIFQQAANRWEQVIVGDLPDATYGSRTVDDLLINASAVAIDGVSGILGQAGPDGLRPGNYLPYHGTMQFDSADMASMEQRGLLLSVVMHEMGHVLGIGTIWQARSFLSGTGTSNPIFVGAQATAAYNQLFGTSARGVPVENTGGAGTAGAHWRETIFAGELMTGWAGPGTNLPLSRVTVGSLADLGYTVNYAAADTFTVTSSLASAAAAAVRSASSTSIVAMGDAATELTSNVSVGLTTGFHSAPTRNSLAGRFAASQIDARLVDRVVADSTDDAADSATRCSEESDARDEFDLAWEQLGIDWEGSAALV